MKREEEGKRKEGKEGIAEGGRKNTNSNFLVLTESKEIETVVKKQVKEYEATNKQTKKEQ